MTGLSGSLAALAALACLCLSGAAEANGRAGREEVAIAEGMALALIVAGIVWAIRLYDRIWRGW